LVTSKYIDNSAYATSGYMLDGANQDVTIGASGVIGGPGLAGGSDEAYTVVNRGQIVGSTSGLTGPSAGVYLQDGGTVTNSGVSDSISAYRVGVRFANVGGVVANTGTIAGTDSFQSYGVVLSAGGSVTNTGARALIEAYEGVVIGGAAGAVTNSGQIKGMNNASIGVFLAKGGTVINSAGGVISATKAGLETYSGAISNAGTIEATGLFNTSLGVYFAVGGSLTNSGSGALIEGASTALYFKGGAGTLTNSGSIIATGQTTSLGVDLYEGGTITNSSGGFIEGVKNAVIQRDGVTLNAGKIEATGSTGRGVYITSGGAVTNQAGGLIQGYYGVLAGSGGSVDNAGAIVGVVDGVDGDRVINEVKGQIKGNVGVALGLGTLVNFGTIASTAGAGGVAVNLTSLDDLFVNEGGSATSGLVTANQGFMDLAGTKGVLTGLGTLFTGFGETTELAGASWTFTGVNQVFSGVQLVFDGQATVAGSITGAGLLGIGGGTTTLVKGASLTIALWEVQKATVVYDVGLTFANHFNEADSTFDLIKDTAIFTGSVSLAGGAIEGAGGVFLTRGVTVVETLAIDTGSQLQLDGSSSLNAVVSGAGLLAIDAGATNVNKNAKLTVGHWQVQKATVIYNIALAYAGQFSETAGLFRLIKDTASFSGPTTFTGGTFTGTGGMLVTKGATALAGLTIEDGVIWGTFGKTTETATLILGNSGGGSGTLTVQAGSVFDINANVGIAIAAGGKGVLTNAGTLEKTAGTGLSLITPAIANTGTIGVTAGTLTLQGAISGAGSETIGPAGVLQVDAAVAATQTAKFAGTAGGTLVLDDPTGTTLGFAGLVSGFGGADKLDLRTFAFAGKPKIAFSQMGTKGTLTVTDGADVAKITLFGQYMATGFRTSADTAGGTLITYAPPAKSASLAAPHL
jgi:hypothetical protein